MFGVICRMSLYVCSEVFYCWAFSDVPIGTGNRSDHILMSGQYTIQTYPLSLSPKQDFSFSFFLFFSFSFQQGYICIWRAKV